MNNQNNVGVNPSNDENGDTPPVNSEGTMEEVKDTGKENENGEITISKNELRGLLSEFETNLESKFSEQLKERDEKIDTLTKAADQTMLGKVLARNKGPLKRDVKLKMFDGKIIMAWKCINDTVKKNHATGVYNEVQTWRIFFDDDSELEVNYTDFTNMLYEERIDGQIISEKKNEDGTVELEVKRKDNGVIVNIGNVFVN